MGALDGPMAKVARSLTSALGGSGTLIRPGGSGGYDPSTGTVSGGGTPDQIAVSVAPGPAATNLFDESLIEAGDRTAIVSRLDVGGPEPNPGSDLLKWMGEVWTIASIEPYGSGDEDAAYALLLRS